MQDESFHSGCDASDSWLTAPAVREGRQASSSQIDPESALPLQSPEGVSQGRRLSVRELEQ